MRPRAVALLAVCASAVAGCFDATGPSLLPSAVIVHPAATDTIYAGVSISLVGRLDPADSTATLRWSSSLDGDLGSGDSITAVLATPGRHVVTLTAVRSGVTLDERRVAVDARRNNVPTLRFSSTASRFFGDSVRLAVRFLDVEDGARPWGGFTWESDVDGPLAGAETYSGTLSVGTHLIRVLARDRGGTVVSDTLRVAALARPTGTAWMASGYTPGWVGEVLISRAASLIGFTYAGYPSNSWLYDLAGVMTATLPNGRVRSLARDGTALVVDSTLRKVSGAGGVVWRTGRLTTTGEADGTEVAEDTDGSVVVVASATESHSYLVINGRALCPDTISTSIVAKYSAGGTRLWAVVLPNSCRRALLGISADGTVYAGVFGYDSLIHVAAIEGATGNVRWSTVVRAPAALAPLAVAPDGTVLVRTSLGTLVALSAADGSVRWTVSSVYSGTAVDAGGTVYVLGRPSRTVTEVRAHALASGAQLWNAVVDTVTEGANTNFAVAADGAVYWASMYRVVRISGPAHTVTLLHDDPLTVSWGPFFDDSGNVVELFADGRLVAWPTAGAASGWPLPHGDHRGTRRVVP